MIDVSTLTLGEVAKIEELSGQPIGDFADIAKPKGKSLAALAYVVKRREQLAAGEHPTFTWNEALNITQGEANELLGLNDEDDPDGDLAEHFETYEANEGKAE